MALTTEEITEQLDANRKALAAASSNAALFQMMQAAQGEVLRLQKEGDRLTAALSAAMDAEAKAERRRFASNFRNTRISVVPNDGQTGIINSTVTVHYERLSWNSGTHENDWVEHNVELRALSRDFLEYIIQYCADLIPADILAFEPGDPAEAVRKYFTALSRGYVRR